MTFSEAIVSFFTNGFNFQGRSRRREYWYVVLLNMIIGGVLGAGSIFIPELKYIDMLWGIIIFIPASALIVRRLHDISLPGWLLLFLYLPIPFLFTSLNMSALTLMMFFYGTMLVLMLIPSDPLPNKYGDSVCATYERKTWYKKVNREMAWLYVIFVLGFEIVYKAWYIYNFIYLKYLTDEDPYWVKHGYEELRSTGLSFILLTIIPCILTFILLSDWTKRGIPGLVVACWNVFVAVARLIEYIPRAKKYLANPYLDDPSSIKYQIFSYSLSIVTQLLFLILFVKYFKGTLKMNKATELLCFAGIFQYAISAVVSTVLYHSKADLAGIWTNFPTTISLICQALPMILAIGLLFRFKQLEEDEVLQERNLDVLTDDFVD